MAGIKLQGHPESFQLDIAAKKIYVNVPDKQQVKIIDLDKQIVIDRWHWMPPIIAYLLVAGTR